MSNLTQRVLSAVVLIPALLYLFYKGGNHFIILIEVVIFLGMGEYYRLVEQKAISPMKTLGTAGALILGLVATTGKLEYMALFLSVLILLTLGAQLRRFDVKTAVTGTATTLFGILYVGWLLSHAILLRLPPNQPVGPDLGLFFVTMAIGGTFGADAGGYFIGRAYGKRKLAPSISPKKTVEGAFGGIAGGTLVVVGVKLFFDIFIFTKAGTGMPFIHCLLLGPILVVSSISGDLSVSIMKRDAEIKDCGNIIPGHGGILDRLDSILFTVPVTFYYLSFVVYRGLW